MLIKPELKDKEIISHLKDAYGLTITTISFLLIGASLFLNLEKSIIPSHQKQLLITKKSNKPGVNHAI